MRQRMLYENETAYIMGSSMPRRAVLPSQISLGGLTHVASFDGNAEADQPDRTSGLDGREQANDESALEPRFQVNAFFTDPYVEPNELSRPESGNENPNAHCGDTSCA
jgi:hypothetical protein